MTNNLTKRVLLLVAVLVSLVLTALSRPKLPCELWGCPTDGNVFCCVDDEGYAYYRWVTLE